MTCKHITQFVGKNQLSSGIDIKLVERTKRRMMMYIELMDGVMKDKDFSHHRGTKFSSIEDLLFNEGQFFDSKIKVVSPELPVNEIYALSQKPDCAYCEGLILPWAGGMPVLKEWVLDTRTNTITTSVDGLHFGAAFNLKYLAANVPMAGQSNLLFGDMTNEKDFLNHGFPEDMLWRKGE